MSWSKIPIALRIAALATIALAVAELVLYRFPSLALSPRVWMMRSGLGFAAKCFAIYGALELATLLPTRAALGAKLAVAGWAATIVIWFAEVAISITSSWQEPIAVTVQWSWWLAMLAIGAGFVVATARRPLVAIAGGVLWLVIVRPPAFDHWMWKQLLDHPDARTAITMTQLALQGAIVLVLAAIAVDDVPAGFAIRDPRRIRSGHRLIASALSLRVIAISALPLVTLFLMGNHNGGSYKALGYAMIAAAAINALSFLGVGLGALDAARANQPDLDRTPFYLAAAGSLWCAGVTLYQLPELYQALFGDRSGLLGERSAETASAFSIVLPVVAAAAIVMWTVGVGAFAVQRERLDLSDRAQRTALWFVVLTAGSVGVSQWLLPEARSDSSALLMLVLALACGLVAIVSAARLARDTAALGNVEPPSIPTATVL